MNNSTHNTDLAIQALENAWESGVAGDFETAIPPEAKDDAELLTELACVDLEFRIQSDAETRIESYTAKFPQLGKDEVALLELIRTEYSHRPDRDEIDSAAYCKRFPELSKQIELMFQLEFNRSGDVQTRRSQSQGQCSSCGGLLPKKTDRTACQICGAPVLIGRYELIERVGQGAFGFVYRARDPKLDRFVAVKVPRANRFLSPEESERFLRESRNAAQLDHAGIVRVYDTGRHEGVPYIVSEFAQGQPLSKILSSQALDFRDAAEVVRKISEAVGHAHDRGVIHRDLKPSNIMAETNSDSINPRVMDFGLARREHIDVSVTLEGQSVGTPAYMSPEQARGDLDAVGVQSDVYSLGVILYQMISGEVPFRGNAQRLIQQVVDDDPPPPSRFQSRIPRDLETICMKAINRELTGRYSGVRDFGEDLANWLVGKPILARRIGTTGAVLRWCRRRPAVAALLGVLALSVVLGVSGITWQWRAAESARLASEADLSDALESVDKVLGHLGSDTLKDIPQAKKLRAEVLGDALVFFQRFQTRSPDDARVAMQVAKANAQVAKIQYALGKNEDAQKAFQAAIDAYERIEDRAPSVEQWQQAVAQSYSGYANFLHRQSRIKEAEILQKKCVAVTRRYLEAKPESVKRRAKFATAQADLGRYVSEIAEAQKLYDESIAELEILVKESKVKSGPQRDLARVLNNYAIRLSKHGQLGKAQACRRQAIELLELVIAADPKDESKRTIYANCCLQLVSSLRSESRVEEVREFQTKAVNAYKSLAQDFPATPRHRERFVQVLSEVGDLALVQKRNQDALKAFEEAVRQSEVLCTLFPNNSRYESQLVDDLWDLADSYLLVAQKPAAEKRMRQSLELQEGLPGAGPAKESVVRAIRLRALASLISKSKSQAKRDEADKLRQEASRLLRDLGVENVLASRLSNAKKIGLLGVIEDLASTGNDSKTVERCLRAKITLFEKGVLENPKLLKRRSGLAKQWASLAKTLRLLERDQEAVKAYRNAIKIDEEVLQEDPDSAAYATLFINHSSSLGQTLQSLGNYDECVEVVQRSLDLAKELHAKAKDEGFLQLRIALAYTQIGNAKAAANKDFKGALVAYEKAVALSGVAKTQAGLERHEGTVLNSLAWFLVTCPKKSFRNPAKALKLANRAVKIAPKNGNFVGTLAFALYESAKYELAIERFKQANLLNENTFPLNTLMIALSQAKLGRLEESRKSYAESVAQNDRSPAEPELFEIYRQQAAAIMAQAKKSKAASDLPIE